MPKKKNKEKVKNEVNLLEIRKKRFQTMIDRKRELGINSKCDRMDALFPPHLVNLDDPNISEKNFNDAFGDDSLFSDKARKSKPLAFEKVTTCVALLVKENPKVIIKAFNENSREKNFLMENVYYENFKIARKIRVLRKYVFQLSKYGIAYWREYIKKTYKKEHEYDESGALTSRWVYDVYDEVAENIHPKNIVLDDNCISVKDVNKPANDLFLFEFLTKEEFDYKYPLEVYSKSNEVQENQSYMVDPELEMVGKSNTDDKEDETPKKIMVIIYENKGEGLRETWANEVPLESVPLPGGELSVQGEKWVEDKDNYDGIGIGQIVEIYQPIVDDILNSSLERLRQIVRPNEDHFNDIANPDEADDVTYGAGAVRRWNGNPKDLVYNTPPPRSAQEAMEMADTDEEIDRATMVPRNLAGTDDAKTAYQSAQNRESALNKLSIPLDAIKYTLEDAANLSMKLFKIIYQEPLETKLLSPEDDEFDEALAILSKEPEGERVVIMDQDKDGNVKQIARRQFRQMELPVTKEPDDEKNSPTGRLVESDEKEFWELVPKTFKWNGLLEIVAESFLPVSKALEDEQKKETIDFLMSIETTDEMGNPVLKDANGQPYMIDRVRLAKERAKIGKHFDADKIIVPLTNQEQVAGGTGNPLASKNDISLSNAVGTSRPEVQPTTSTKK